MTRVAIVSDDDGHDYIIPYEELNKFHDLLSKAYSSGYEDVDEFEEAFGGYRLGGDINSEVELYTK